MKRLMVVTVCLAALFLAACEKKPAAPPPPTRKEKPPPTQAELASQLRSTYSQATTAANANQPLADDVAGGTLGNFSNTVKRLRGVENGLGAIAEVEPQVYELAETYFEQEKWKYAILFCDLYSAINPQSEKLQRIRERSVAQRDKPKVTFKSFFADETTGEVTVFLEVQLSNGSVHSVTATPGDEFFGLRFTNIIGRMKGIELEYLQLGESFQVMKAPASRPRRIIPQEEQPPAGGGVRPGQARRR